MKSSRPQSIVKLSLIAFFALTVLAPLVRMLFFITSDDLSTTLTQESFRNALNNSLSVALLTTLISTVLALLLSFCMTRTNIRLKGAWSVLFVLPMLIPSLSHGTGLVVLLGNNGLLTRLFSLNTNIYGMFGVVLGSVLYSFPVAFLMVYDVLRREDGTVYEAADVLGLSKTRQFCSITLPYLRKPLISVVFAIFTLVVTDYGVPLMVGGNTCKTLAVLMYEDVVGQLEFGKGAVMGLVLLIPAILAFFVDLLTKDRAGSSFVIKPYPVRSGKLRDALSYLLCATTTLFVFLPVFAFGLMSVANKYPRDLSFSLDHIERAFERNAGNFLANSLIIAVLTSLIGVAIAYFCAYFASRTKGALGKTVHLMSILSLAIPGLVLGLSYVLFFKSTPIYGTIAIIVLVNTIHFFSSPYLMMYNSFSKFNENLEAVGDTLGISRSRMLFFVFLPQSWDTIAEMFSYFFANSMMTISAVSFLATSSAIKPISLLINEFEHQMMRECIAVVSLIILIVNLILKTSILLIRKSIQRKNQEKEASF